MRFVHALMRSKVLYLYLEIKSLSFKLPESLTKVNVQWQNEKKKKTALL